MRRPFEQIGSEGAVMSAAVSIAAVLAAGFSTEVGSRMSQIVQPLRLDDDAGNLVSTFSVA
jgi:hypothetical protein